MKHNHIIIILLAAIAILLSAILLKDWVSNYFRAQEIKKRANIYNIPNVAVACLEIFTVHEVPNNCGSVLKSYRPKIEKWDNLISKKANVNCSDFIDKKEANEFYTYINGEIAEKFYSYWQNEHNTVKRPDSFYFIGDDQLSTYDPYNLDTDRDFAACENYGN